MPSADGEQEHFDQIQEAVQTVSKPRHQRGDKGFIFTGFATCGYCGYCISAERHLKKSGLRFAYYRCTRKNKREPCRESRFLRAEAMASEVKRNVALVTIPDEWKERFIAKIETWEGELQSAKESQIKQLRAELAAVKEKLDRLNNAFADGGLDLTEFKEMKNPLVPKKVELEQKLVVLTKGNQDRLEPFRNFILQANGAEKLVRDEDWLEMKSFLKMVGSNRVLHAQSLNVSFKKPWNLLAETNLAFQKLVNVSQRFKGWWSRGDSNS